MTVQSWPAGTVVMLATQGDGPHVIPVSAALRTPDGDVLLALAESRGSLSRLKADPRVALLVLAAGDVAVTLYGRAAVVDGAFADRVVAVRVIVERVVGHERASFVIESGVGWHWTDESAEARDAEVQAALARLASTVDDSEPRPHTAIVSAAPSLPTDPALQAAFEVAYREARDGLEVGGIPIGSSLMIAGTVVASGHNERVQRGDPVAHGEISCLRNAGRRRDYGSATICTTLAPCDMCTGAIVLFGIPNVVVGEDQTFPGSLDYLRARGVRVTVLGDQRCVALMREFQERWPSVWAEDIGH